MDFSTRYAKLNSNQQQAVDEINRNLLVIAGPGTGKTELLSMRTASILKQTDSLPSSILCLTFTDSAASNMRQRLQQIIGEMAYKVAIHTFHSFGVEIINQNSQYFFRGSDFTPADELSQFQIIHQLLSELAWDHPLASRFYDDFIYLKSLTRSFSDFKKSGLSEAELRSVIESNQRIFNDINPQISQVFASTITKATIVKFSELTNNLATTEQPDLPLAIASYPKALVASMALAAQEAIETDKTSPITAWKNKWCTKNEAKQTVLKDSLQADKLLATIELYGKYNQAMSEAKLYDYDDMILSVIEAIDKYPDLKANLQEQFQYIMVDEFQDTNLAQLRLLFAVADKQSTNVMVVGDDDQAIFSFQGADIGNIQRYRQHFDQPKIIALTDNYRSAAKILELSRQVITQGTDRLENTVENLSKQLTPWFEHPTSTTQIDEYPSQAAEAEGLTEKIQQLLADDVQPENIAVLARHHKELIELLPYFNQAKIGVSYEKRDNAFEHQLIILLEKIINIILALRNNQQDTANQLLPEMITQPGFGYEPLDIWKLSLSAYRNRQFWLETMLADPVFSPMANWLIGLAAQPTNSLLEAQIDQIIGINQPGNTQDGQFVSPLAEYYFSAEKLATNPEYYLGTIEALRTIRDGIRSHYNTQSPQLGDFIDFIELYRQLGKGLTITRQQPNHQKGLVNLISAHGAKGLEFDHIFIIGANEKRWGETATGRSENINYPVNLQLRAAGSNYDERLRLFFVAMTRARRSLTISFSNTLPSGKSDQIASFLSQQEVTQQTKTQSIESAVSSIEIDWRARLIPAPATDLKTVLASTLENYKMPVTHLNNFIDITIGGPANFLVDNLLKLPHAKSVFSEYGTAIHDSLRLVHTAKIVDGKLPPIETILDDFTKELQRKQLTEDDFLKFNDKGRQTLQRYIEQKADRFTDSQLVEFDFARQGVVIDQAQLTGKLDLIDIDRKEKTIFVTDYKTGQPYTSWQSKNDKINIKLHKYRQQLMFYQLLVENSQNYSGYRLTGTRLQFVEPKPGSDQIIDLVDSFTEQELSDFRRLISAVYQRITNLDIPDISQYPQDYEGLRAFEDYLRNN